MDTGWIRDGYGMDTGWIRDGYGMDTGWIRDGYGMDTGWIPRHYSIYGHPFKCLNVTVLCTCTKGKKRQVGSKWAVVTLGKIADAEKIRLTINTITVC